MISQRNLIFSLRCFLLLDNSRTIISLRFQSDSRVTPWDSTGKQSRQQLLSGFSLISIVRFSWLFPFNTCTHTHNYTFYLNYQSPIIGTLRTTNRTYVTAMSDARKEAFPKDITKDSMRNYVKPYYIWTSNSICKFGPRC